MSGPGPQQSPGANYVAFHTASSPAQANVVRALLEASGIPAHVEGQMLADEFAISRTLMNLQSVRVFVRGTDVERAREVLANAAIDEDELERQALAEAPDPAALPRAHDGGEGSGSTSGGRVWAVLSVLFALTTILFFTLWMDARTAASWGGPLFDIEPMPDGLRYRWRGSGALAMEYHDARSDGIWERVDSYDREGRLYASAFDTNQDGMLERFVNFLPDGLRHEWIDTDGDGLFEGLRITREDGTLIRELRSAGEQGFVEVGR